MSYPNYETCLKWKINYHNISKILCDNTEVYMDAAGVWIDENNRYIACELEYDCVQILGHSSISLGTQILLFRNDVESHILKRGMFIRIKTRGLYKQKYIPRFSYVRWRMLCN